MGAAAAINAHRNGYNGRGQAALVEKPQVTAGVEQPISPKP
jgi:hypothetical protein